MSLAARLLAPQRLRCLSLHQQIQRLRHFPESSKMPVRTASLLSLPVEVHEQIFANVCDAIMPASLDRSSFATAFKEMGRLQLICLALRDTVRAQTYRHLMVTSPKAGSALYLQLVNTPKLGHNIQTLELCSSGGMYPVPLALALQLLSSCRQLKDASLPIFNADGGTQIIQALPQTVRSLRLHSTINGAFVNISLDLLGRFELDNMALFDVGFTTLSLAPVILYSCTLAVTTPNACLYETLDMPSLHPCRMHLYYQNFTSVYGEQDAVTELVLSGLRLVGPYLQHLVIVVEYGPNSDPLRWDDEVADELAQFPALETLKLHTFDLHSVRLLELLPSTLVQLELFPSPEHGAEMQEVCDTMVELLLHADWLPALRVLELTVFDRRSAVFTRLQAACAVRGVALGSSLWSA